MEKKAIGIAVALIVIILAAATFAGLYLKNQSQTTEPTQGTYQGSKIQVVAGENFWGSLISQLGGSRTQVLSIVTDPNADPHEYESNSQNAQAVANCGACGR